MNEIDTKKKKIGKMEELVLWRETIVKSLDRLTQKMREDPNKVINETGNIIIDTIE